MSESEASIEAGNSSDASTIERTPVVEPSHAATLADVGPSTAATAGNQTAPAAAAIPNPWESVSPTNSSSNVNVNAAGIPTATIPPPAAVPLASSNHQVRVRAPPMGGHIRISIGPGGRVSAAPSPAAFASVGGQQPQNPMPTGRRPVHSDHPRLQRPHPHQQPGGRLQNFQFNGATIQIRTPSRGGPVSNHRNANGSRPRGFHLPRLQPVILPESEQEWNDLDDNTNDTTTTRNADNTVNDNEDGTPQNKNDDDTYNPFKCGICYEIMNDPAGCGKCSARFCFSCLLRVSELSVLQHRQQQHVQQYHQQQPGGLPANAANTTQATNTTNTITSSSSTPSARCPVCRSKIDDPEDIVRDNELRQRMELAPPTQCRFKGCAERLRLTQIAQHETSCPHVLLSCRHLNFGCQWKGTRGDLAQHEQQECHLEKISALVTKLRGTQAETFHRIAHLEQNVAMQSAVIELLRLREANQMSTSNYIQGCQYTHLLLCCTPRFLITKDVWAPFFNNTKGRATLSNFWILLPTNILMMKTMANAYQQLLFSSSTPLETEEELLEMVDGILYFLIVVCLGIIIGICFFADFGTAEEWQMLPIPLPRRWFPARTKTHVLLYAATFAVVAAHTFAFEFSGNAFRATMTWLALCLTSTLFPAIVMSMAEAISALPTTIMADPGTFQRILSMGRTAAATWLGLCYSPCIVTFGPLPCIDAVVLLCLCEDGLKKILPARLWSLKDEVLSNIPLQALYVYGGARLAIKAPEFASLTLIQSFDFVLVSLVVVVIKLMLLENIKIGIRVGIFITSQSRARVVNQNANLLKSEYHGAGVAMFGLWCLLLGAISTT